MNVMGGLDFVATHNGKSICELSISSPGRHNVLNALAVFVSAMIDPENLDFGQPTQLFHDHLPRWTNW